MAISNVVIAIAMEAEANPFVQHLGLQPDPAFFPAVTPFRAFRGKRNNCDLTVVTNGMDAVHGTGLDNVGTVPASLAVFLALQRLDADEGRGADLLVNAGTCGGFRREGAAIGDVYLTTSAVNHDRRIEIPGTKFATYGTGRVASAEVRALASHLGAKTGVVSTGNSLDAVAADEARMLESGAAVKDMEAAAIAWTASMWGTPHFGVKVVTDIVDGEKPTHQEFLANLASAATSLQGALPKVLDFVCGKEHDEL